MSKHSTSHDRIDDGQPNAGTEHDQRQSNRELIRRYLEVATPGSLDPDRIREFLADDVVIDDPLMAISGADAFTDALRQVPNDETMGSTVQHIVADDDLVAARVLFTAGEMEVQFAQWFWLDGDRITRIEVVYDPRPFLGAAD